MVKLLSLICFFFAIFNAIGQCDLQQKVNYNLSDTTALIYASEAILANAAINGNSDITFQAEREVELLPGFHATNPANFLALIATCPDSLIKGIVNIPKEAGIVGKARNIWDLQVYKGKLYIGYGSTTQNTGPTVLWAYDLTNETVAPIDTIASEAIERFRVWNDTLFVPNSDPTSGDARKLTFLTENHISQEFSLNHGMAHVRDVYFFNGRYYLVGNTRCPGSKELNCAGIITTTDFSQNYTNTLLQAELSRTALNNGRWNWFFGLMEVDSQLVIPNAMFTKAYHPNLTIKNNLLYLVNSDGILTWSAYQSPSTQLTHPHFYTVDTTSTTIDTAGVLISLRVFEHASYHNKTLFTLRTYSMFNAYYQAQYNNSAGLMLKDSLRGAAKNVNFPAANAMGEDLKIIDGQLYVLANEKISQDSFHIYVYTTTTPSEAATSWTEVLQFDSKNMARSFEYADGFFYFGLGFNQGDAVNNAGEVIRVAKDVQQE